MCSIPYKELLIALYRQTGLIPGALSMMKVIVASTNPIKLSATKLGFANMLGENKHAKSSALFHPFWIKCLLNR